MLGLLWIVPALPLAGFLLLVLAGRWLPRRLVAMIGVGAVALAALAAAALAVAFLLAPPAGHSFTQVLWTWMQAGNFSARVALRLDALSLVMMLVVTWVGALIHLYSSAFMQEEGYSRFFAYMNLFVASMLVLVLADDLLLLYLGWEGVGLCSYLLIGFWYQDAANGRAARKAFVVTRIGDTALAIGLFLIYTNLGTLQIQEVARRALQQWPAGSGLAVAAAALLLGGAVGKSAQLPLQVWLPDAMAGPTPVSALIHAATMVTAGVYLIARSNALFSLAPAVQSTVAAVGAVTLLLAGCSALTQRDIKRALAYSTISQIGYMFLALGVGAWSAAVFHLVTHAFFKALLFLAAGVVIVRLEEEHDVFKMGGLRRELPLVFWTFTIGAASLSALPLLTAGFYSKDLILWQAWSAPAGSPWLWAAGLVGALLTSLYAFRLVFLAFFGLPQPLVRAHSPMAQPGIRLALPLVVLAILALVGGLVEVPSILGGRPFLSTFLATALPALPAATAGAGTELVLLLTAAGVSLGGIGLAYLLFLAGRSWTIRLAGSAVGSAVRGFWFAGWGFDWLGDRVARAYAWLARLNQADVVDRLYQGIAWLAEAGHGLLSRTQSGRLRWYALGIGAGAVLVIAMVVFL